MAHAYTTDKYEGIIAETISIQGGNGDRIHAYLARPLGTGPFPALVFLHHLPGWDEWSKETVRKLAYHGYVTISHDLYCRADHGTPEDVTAKVRADGGVADDQVVGDAAAAAAFLRSLPYVNGKVGVLGTCSGGRHSYLAATRTKSFNAIVDLWGGRVVMAQNELTPKQPVAPIDYTKDLPCPILGIFGLEDRSPTAEQVDQHEAELKKHGKQYEFHRYAGAGHGIFYYDRPLYRQEQAVDGWKKMLAFLDKNLQ
jgi:carboxymethylenebutenolidase